MVIEV